MYLRTIVAASIEHEPKVREELDESPPAYIRTARHLDGKQKMYQPPVYNYQAAVQQDRLQSRYSRQQKSDSRNLKIAPINHDVLFGLQQYISQNRGTPMSIPFEDNGSDWKPYQPKFLNAAKPIKYRPIKPKNEISEVKHKTDLDIAGSETKEHTAETDRHDQRTQYVYVTQSTLRDKFGLDAKTTKQILQNSAPGREETNSDQYQISELQGLLGKNPSFQLQGLQKLLEDAKPIVENNLPISSEKDSGIQINHNGSPSVTATGAQLETLQQQLDALNKAQEEQIIAAAQKQAEAHVKAQHEALALVQKKAQDEALSKIAAHNQGLSTISPSEILNIPESVDHSTAAPFISENSHASEPNPQEHAQEINQNSLELHKESYVNSPEVQALQERPVDEVLVHPAKEYPGRYTSTTQDLRKNKPRIQGARGRFYVQPDSFTRPSVQQHQLQYLSAVPHLYNVNEVQSYSPVSPYTPHSSVQNEIDFPKVIPETIVTVPTPTLQEHGYESYQQNYVDPSAGNGQQLYSEDQHQYDDVSKVFKRKHLRFKRGVQKKKHINFSFNGSKIITTDLDIEDFNSKLTDKLYDRGSDTLIRSSIGQNQGNVLLKNRTDFNIFPLPTRSNNLQTNKKQSDVVLQRRRFATKNVQNNPSSGIRQHIPIIKSNTNKPGYINPLAAYSKKHETFVNPSLDLYKQSQKVLNFQTENPKNVIIINNSNTNEGPKNENHLFAPQNQKLNNNFKHVNYNKNIVRHIPTKTFVPKSYSFKRVIPKIIRAEKKVQIALDKIG